MSWASVSPCKSGNDDVPLPRGGEGYRGGAGPLGEHSCSSGGTLPLFVVTPAGRLRGRLTWSAPPSLAGSVLQLGPEEGVYPLPQVKEMMLRASAQVAELVSGELGFTPGLSPGMCCLLIWTFLGPRHLVPPPAP